MDGSARSMLGGDVEVPVTPGGAEPDERRHEQIVHDDLSDGYP